jgi:hypothetical protein
MKAPFKWRNAVEKRLAVAALVGCSTFAAFVGAPEAASRFALTCIENKTNETLNYSFRWGEDGPWSSRSLQPNAARSHSWRYSNPNVRKSPGLYIKFDSDLSGRMINQGYRLESYASPQETDCKAYGREYVFRYDGNARKYIDLKGVR